MNVEAAAPAMLLPAATLWRREVVRFLRQRSRVVGALGTPLVFWLVIGSGFGESVRPPGTSSHVPYLEYFLPGTLLLILLFTAVFSTVSVIEDRREGFLQGVLVAPVSRAAIVLGKLLGGTTLAVGQGLLFLGVSPLVGVALDPLRIAAVLVVSAVVAFGLTGLGFLIAWPLESTQGFHAIMNLFLIPLWLLSGALFPAEGAAGWVRMIMAANPLSYSLAAIRGALYFDVSSRASIAGLAVPLGLSLLFAVLLWAASSVVVSRWGGRSVS